MSKNENLTQANGTNVQQFLKTIKDETKRQDSEVIIELLTEISGHPPIMWGKSIVGFGTYHYKYTSGREGDFLRIGFSPRVQNLTIYIMPGYQDFKKLLDKLGPHSTGKSCLYIKRLSDIHIPTLKQILKKGYRDMAKLYPEN
jgi:hypothetical protein